MPDRPLLVVDAPSLLYRAFFALPTTITDGRDRPVNALLGALNMIMRVVADHSPRAVVLAFGLDAAIYRLDGARRAIGPGRRLVGQHLVPTDVDGRELVGAAEQDRADLDRRPRVGP